MGNKSGVGEEGGAGINVLSLFDGMSCGQIALQKLGIKVNNYFACEIDKHAIKSTQFIFPNTIQLGDVSKVSAKDLPKIDLLLGGSPCQGFSFAGKQLAFDDPRSMLFFEYVRLWREVKELNPDAKFLLENVPMKKEHEIVISQYMGIAPIKINSSLVSAQNRERLYWTNIKNEPYGLFGDLHCTIPQPKGRGIFLKDVLEREVDEKYFLSDKMLNYFNKRAKNFNQGKVNIREEEGKASCLTSSMSSCDISDNFIKIDTKLNKSPNQNKANCFTAGGNSGGLHSDMDLIIVASRGRNPEDPKRRKPGLPTEQQLEARNDGKTNCLTSVQKDNYVVLTPKRTEYGKAVRKDYENGKIKAKRSEITELQPREDGKTNTLSTVQKDNLVMTSNYIQWDGIGFDQDRRAYFTDSKSGTLDTKANRQKIIQDRIRRLTPRECGRLQTVPEDILDKMLKSGVSDTQLYRMFGNGWTVDVIAHILGYFKNPES